MRWIGRYIFNALTILSLLLCAAAIALWVYSPPSAVRLHTHSTSFTFHRRTLAFSTSDDMLTVKWIVKRPPSPPSPPSAENESVVDAGMRLQNDVWLAVEMINLEQSMNWHGFAGIDVLSESDSAELLPDLSRFRIVAVPLLFVAGVFTLLPAWRGWRWRRTSRVRQRVRLGSCAACGV